MQTLDYQPMNPIRRKWYCARNLVLFGVSAAFLAVAMGIAWSRYQATQAFVGQLGTRIGQEQVTYVWKSYDEMHAAMLYSFVNSQGFGADRMYRAEDWNPNGRLWVDGKLYAVGTVELVSLKGGQAPFAYVTTASHEVASPFKNTVKASKHRPLDQPEVNALEQLKQGKQVVTCNAANHLALVGAVRAQASCLECHNDVKVGTLVGAFTYPLVAVNSKP